MNLVELNLDTIPFGHPIPFALRGVGGSLLASKGFVLHSPDDLRTLLERGQHLYVDIDESGDSYRAYMNRLHAMLMDGKSLGSIATATLKQAAASAQVAHSSGSPAPSPVPLVEDQLPHWPNWQRRLTYVLRHPEPATFCARFEQIFSELAHQVQKFTDNSLLALIQLSAEETRFYSATHAMLVSAVCMTVARDTLRWPEAHTLTLGRAALSMNLSMSRLQDDLSEQTTPLTAQQANEVDQHPEMSVQMLKEFGITDNLWLEAVKCHHHRAPGKLSEKPLGQQMARLIQRADIFGARIAPRLNRQPMAVTSAMQASYYDETKSMDEAGAALVKTLGIYPPGAWVKLTSSEIGIVVRRGSHAATPKVMVLVNRAGMPTGEPIPRDTASAAWKIVSPVAHKDVRVRLPLEKLLSL